MLMRIELGVILKSSSFLFLTSITIIFSLIMILNPTALMVLFSLKKGKHKFCLEINLSQELS